MQKEAFSPRNTSFITLHVLSGIVGFDFHCKVKLCLHFITSEVTTCGHRLVREPYFGMVHYIRVPNDHKFKIRVWVGILAIKSEVLEITQKCIEEKKY